MRNSINNILLFFRQFLPTPMLRITVLTIISSLIIPFTRDMVFIPMKTIADQYQFQSDMWFSGLFSIYVLAIALGQLFWGWMSEKFNYLHVFRLGMVVLFGTSILVPLTDNLYQLILLRIGQGLGISCQIIMARVLVFQVGYDHRYLAQSFSLSKGLVLFAAIISPITTTWISTHLTWQFNFIIVSLMAVIVAGFSFMCHETDTTSGYGQNRNLAVQKKQMIKNIVAVDSHRTSRYVHGKLNSSFFLLRQLSNLRQLWYYQTYRFYTLVGLLGFVLIGAFFPASNLLFLQILDLNLQVYGLITTLHMSAAAVGVICNSWLVRYYDLKKILHINITIVTLVYLLWFMQILLQGLQLWSAVMFMSVISFFTSCITANAMTLSVLGLNQKTSINAFSQLGVIHYTTTSIMSMITGALILYQVTFFILVMFLICSVVCFSCLNQTYYKT